ncbi:FG-GAP-like repeat-containing protein [Halalkalibaculum sp. DA384]|uniref:FG-GAP-like repeat-containing protein n=1 Tax=Halalkalibaculum sp. DA384 TaxID=3373606 RepID=UPI003754FD80
MPKVKLVLVYVCVALLLAVCKRDADPAEQAYTTGSSSTGAPQEEFHDWTPVEPGNSGETGFQKLESSETGIEFTHRVTQEEISQNRFLLDGTGVATADVDGDGLTDIYFSQMNGPNKLYRNLGGFQFEDITEQAGVAHSGNYSTGTLFADVNGDGSPDLLVATVDGENAVYINNGEGRFELKKDSRLKPGSGSTTMTMADIDGDGDLDLYIAYYREKRVYDLFDEKELRPTNILRRVDDGTNPGNMQFEFNEPFGQYYDIIYRKNKNPTVVEIGEPNKLYINDGSGQFTEVTSEKGRFLKANGEPFTLKPEWSLTARFQDINGDQHPDLYICNDYFSPDRIWINQGNGTFREMDPNGIRKFSYSAMGVDISDINRDGHADFFVTDMLSPDYMMQASQNVSKEKRPAMITNASYQPQYMHNTMYLNRGDNTFREIAYYSGVEASGWSWATRFMDIDLDGYEDLIINTGYPYDAMDMDFIRNKGQYEAVNLEKAAPKLDLRNQIFRNNGDLTFSEQGEQWGFNETDVSYGLATADFDNDGDLDVVTTRFRAEPAIFKNKSAAPRISVRLHGQSPNTQGIGARVILEGGPVTQSKDLVAGGDYLSGSDPRVTFAADPGNGDHTLVVKWPGGKTTKVEHVAANRIYDIYEPEERESRSTPESGNEVQQPVFEDISARVGHRHTSDSHDDFERQPLLPFKLSAEGPGVTWIDYDMDGDDDLFIGGNSTDKLSVYENRGNGQFNRIELAGKEALSPGVSTSILGWPTAEHFNMVIGNSDYQLSSGRGSIPAGFRFMVGRDGSGKLQNIPGINASAGPVAVADYDSDGDLDLFVGGRVIPGLYPLSGNSVLFSNENGRFVEDESQGRTFNKIGMVTGAVFTDYDADGDPDLIISTEWGPVKLFENQDGTFSDITEATGLGKYSGRWSSVATGDFNNDGLIDIVATNLGENSPYQLRTDHPLKIYHNDFNNDGSMEMIEARYDVPMEAYIPMRKLYEYSVFGSIVSGPVNSYEQYAGQSLQQLLGTPLSQLPSKEVNTLKHMVFLNTGDGFEAHPLPTETQFTTGNGIVVADYNNDGSEDLFMTQNYFDVPEGFPRQDAGRGILLKGDGTGRFVPVGGPESGIKIYGQQRGAAFSDFNKDGKVDLAVAQRDSTTKLYMNRVSRPGIRVELQGPGQNQAGIGTTLRVVYDDGTKGPLREVQAGTGHYSMNSLVAVLGTHPEKQAIQLEVHWFDGEESSISLESQKKNYRILYPSL